MMHKNSHIFQYLTLVLGLFIFVIALVFFEYNNFYIQIVLALASLFYFCWGIMHHAIEGRLTKHIVLEYLLFSLLVFVIATVALQL